MKIAKAVEFDTPVSPETFEAKVIRNAVTSPDGKTVVFNALGYLWAQKLPDGTPKRLTSGTDFEFEPAFSPSGNEIVYVTWNDENLGAIYKIPVKGGSRTKLSTQKGIYRNPSFSHNGKHIAYIKEESNNEQGRTFDKKPGIYTMNADGTQVKFITKDGDYPIYNADDSRIIYQTGGVFFGELTKELVSVDINGYDKRTLVKSEHGNRLVPSPDGKWLAFMHLFKVYIAPMPKSGQTLDMTDKTKFVPVTQLSKDAGINIHWSSDSKTLHWTFGNEYF